MVFDLYSIYIRVIITKHANFIIARIIAADR